MIKGTVVHDSIFISNNSITLKYEDELKVVNAGEVKGNCKLIFVLPDSWKDFRKVACITAGKECEYIPLFNNNCELPNKFNGATDITVQLMRKNKDGSLTTSNTVKLR